jgi:hypothetical protein
MSRELPPAEIEQRAAELRDLWRQFDPLRLGPEAGDTYDSHVEPLLRVLEGEGDVQELSTEVRIIMQDFMDLDWSSEREAEADVFASRVMAWWNGSWEGTRG